jgi:hypothetical protein
MGKNGDFMGILELVYGKLVNRTPITTAYFLLMFLYITPV